MVGKSVIWSVKWPKKATEGSFISVKNSQKLPGFVQWFIRLQQLKEMQSSKLGMTKGGNICQWKECEKGSLFWQKCYIKKWGVGPQGGASLYKT